MVEIIDLEVLVAQNVVVQKARGQFSRQREIVAGVERDGRHIVAQPPEAVLVHQIIVAVGSMVETQALGLRMLCADVLRHAVDVPHQLHGMLVGVGVDTLDEIGLICAKFAQVASSVSSPLL